MKIFLFWLKFLPQNYTVHLWYKIVFFLVILHFYLRQLADTFVQSELQ